MARGKKSHALAHFREVAGLSQQELAELVGCSHATVQSIELGRLGLSEKLAERIHTATGIGLKWLLENDPSKPPVDWHGRPYTQQTFEEQQGGLELGYDAGLIEHQLTSYFSVLCRCFLEAHKAKRLGLLKYRLSRFFHELQKDLGFGAKEQLVGLEPEGSEEKNRFFRGGRPDVQRILDASIKQFQEGDQSPSTASQPSRKTPSKKAKSQTTSRRRKQ